MNISLSDSQKKGGNFTILFKKLKELESLCSKQELNYLEEKVNDKEDIICVSSPLKFKQFVLIGKKGGSANEIVRKAGNNAAKFKGDSQLINGSADKEVTKAFIEGFVLGSYQFDKYQGKPTTKKNSLKVVGSKLKQKDLAELKGILSGVQQTRDWVNEPVNKLTTEQYISDFKQFSDLGVDVEVFRKSKISSLNMGGILAVNQGSPDEPALGILEWKPKNAKNKKPIVLVGKGVLFDTGGINIKTGNFMTDMKADMGGSATVLGALLAVAKNELPIHVVTLVPITENRINGKEIVPGDVITMHNGKTVEVLNTDAEGRLILADALSFAKKYKPELVIDAATLTGSAYRTSGHYGGVVMGTAEEDIQQMKAIGDDIYERMVELPMWPEFEKSLKSNVADINNLGDGAGQAVCAGFFLKNFVSYPWIHMDIAGPAFVPSDQAYVKKGGTGFGVRLLYQFLKDKFGVK